MKKVKQLLILTAFLFSLSSCYTSRERSSADGWSDVAMTNADAGYFNGRAEKKGELYSEKRISGNDDEIAESQRKIVYTANLRMTIKSPDSANVQLQNIAKKYNGYSSEIGTYRTTIRVKSQSLKQAVEEIKLLGKLESESLHGNDVTADFLDFGIRLDNAQKARVRYLELLKKAENVEAALLVEKELERLNGTIDMLKGKMNQLDHLSEFSTITVQLKEKKKPGLLGYIGIGVYKSIKWLFVRN